MDLFRRKQKLIFWIVTIIIVPSFVLVWGVSDFGGGQGFRDFDVGTVNGKSVKFSEYDRFRRRFTAALGGMPLQVSNIPGIGSEHEDLYKYLFLYALAQDGEKAGVTASDKQVGTYIENGHPSIAPSVNKNDPQSKERAVDNLCRQMQISRQDFVQGVREWQTIGNYIQADSDLLAVNSESLYTFYALNNGECVIKRIHFLETDAVKEQAKSEIMAKPAEELEQDIRNHIAANASDARFRNQAKWRFAYVFLPFVSEDAVRQPTEADIQGRYDQNRSTTYANRPLTEVADAIKADLIKEEIDRQTLRNFSVDVDPQLQGQGLELALPELSKLTQLVKHGAAAQDTGEELLTTSEVLAALPQGSDFRFRLFLETVDGTPEPARQNRIDEWKGGYILDGNPFRAEKGMFRMRLVDYQPSSPMDIDTPEGGVKPEVFEMALADLVGNRASEIVRADAEEMERKLYDYLQAKEKGETAPDAVLAAEFEGMPTNVVPYRDMSDANYPMVRMAIGDVLGPHPYRDPETGERGQEIVVMVGRRMPSRDDFAREPEPVKDQLRQIALNNFQGNYGFTFTMNGPVAIVRPSPTITAGLADRYYKGQIRVDESKFTVGEGEG